MQKCLPSLTDTAAAFRKRALLRDSSILKQAASNTAVPLSKCLGLSDLVLATIGSTIGAGIFVVTGVAAREDAGPAVILSYVLAGLAAFLSGLCYIEYVVETPLTGGAFNYMHLTFGEYAAWICACNMVLEYTLSTAAVSRGFSGYLATLLGLAPDTFILPVGSWVRLDLLALVLVALLCALLCYGTSTSSYVNNVITSLEVIIILYVLAAGLPSAKPAYMADFAPFGLRGIFHAASVCFFAFVGFDAVATCAEEAKDPAKDLPVAILGGLGICTVLYLAMAAAICLMQPWQSIDLDAPFAVAFLAASPPSGFKRLFYATSARFVSLGAIAGIVTTALITLLGQARIYVSLGRSRLLPARLAEVHPQRLTPNNATLLSCLSAGLLAFVVDLDILATLVSVGTLATFFMISAGTLWRRYWDYDQPVRPALLALLAGIPVCSLGLSLSYTAGASWPVQLVFGTLWLASTAGLLLQPVQFVPEAYAVPLTPLTPALALLADMHLICSLGWQAYVRFLVWLVLSTAVYLLYSVHQPQPGKDPREEQASLYNRVGGDLTEVGMTQQYRLSSLDSEPEEAVLHALTSSSSPRKPV